MWTKSTRGSSKVKRRLDPKMAALLSIALALASGILLSFGFPPYDRWFLPWIVLSPLLVILASRKTTHAFFLSYLFGMAFFLGIFNWILEVPGYRAIHHVILALYLGLYFALFGATFNLISRRLGLSVGLLMASFIWVSLEYVRSHLSFMALPWGLLAHSQYQVPLVIQIAAIGGAWGVGFLLVLVNAAFAAAGMALVRKSKERESGKKWVMASAAFLMGVSLLHGYAATSRPISGRRIRVSLVQGNIDQRKKWDPKYANFIIETYEHLSQQAAKARPELIVWPETATPRAINRDPRLHERVKKVSVSSGAYVLLGSAQMQKLRVKEPKSAKYVNSAFLIHPDKELKENQRYDKIRLLPFGEYLPYKNEIPWSYLSIPDVGNYLPGKAATVFNFPRGRFGVTICWENIFPDLFRQFVKNGAQFMINITNEAWFGRTAAPYQFLSMSVFRAVENHIYVLRCANTGISCFIDPYGRVVKRLRDSEGRDIFVRGVLTGTVIPLNSKTFYSVHGDWLPWVCIAFSIGLVIATALYSLWRGFPRKGGFGL